MTGIHDKMQFKSKTTQLIQRTMRTTAKGRALKSAATYEQATKNLAIAKRLYATAELELAIDLLYLELPKNQLLRFVNTIVTKPARGGLRILGYINPRKARWSKPR